MPTIANSNADTRQEISTLAGVFNSSNYASIQAAVNAAEIAGGTVYIPPGTHSVSASITIDSSNVSILIDAGATLQATAALSTGVIYVDSTGGTVSNIQIHGNGLIDGNSQTTTKGIYINGTANNVHISDIEITDTSDWAIMCKGTDTTSTCNDVVVQGVYLHDVNEGLLFQYCSSTKAIGCTAYDMTGQDCFETSSSVKASFEHCYARNPAAGNACFDIYNSCEDITITGCHAYQTVTDASGPLGIMVSTGTNKNINIIGNIVSGNVTSTQGASGSDTKSFNVGINVLDGEQINIIGNNIYGVCYGVSLGYGIIFKADSGIVSSNNIERCSASSVYVQNVAGNIKIDNNICKDSHWDTDATDTGVIVIAGTAPPVWSASNNSFVNGTTLEANYYIAAIYTGNSTSAVVSNNTSDGGVTADAGLGNPVSLKKPEILQTGNSWMDTDGGDYWNGNVNLNALNTNIEAFENGYTFYLNRTAGNTVTLPMRSELYAGWTVRFIVRTPNTTGDYVITEDTSIDTNQLRSVISQPHDDGASQRVTDTAHTQVNFKSGVASYCDYIDVTYDANKFMVVGSVQTTAAITLT